MSGDSVMGYSDEDAETAVGLALGRASACWDNLDGAGTFDSTTACRISEELVAHLRKLRLMPDPPAVRTATAIEAGDRVLVTMADPHLPAEVLDMLDEALHAHFPGVEFAIVSGAAEVAVQRKGDQA